MDELMDELADNTERLLAELSGLPMDELIEATERLMAELQGGKFCLRDNYV